MFDASTNFLDIWGLMVDEIIGSVLLFIVICILLVLFLSLKYNLPFQVMLLSVALLILVFFIKVADLLAPVYILLIIVAAVIFYLAMKKVLTKT